MKTEEEQGLIFSKDERGKIMQKPTYTNSDITKFATVNEARQRYRLSRGMVTKLASDNDALMKIGNCVRIDVSVLDNVISNFNVEYKTPENTIPKKTPKSKLPINENTYIIKILSDIWKEDIAENISQIIDTLSEIEKRVIIEHYKNGKTFREIAEELNFSSTYPHQIYNVALRKMRHPSRRLAIFCKREIEEREELLIKIKQHEEAIKEMQEAILKQSFTDIERIKGMIAVNVKISDINLSARAEHCLRRSGIDTLSQLSELTRIDLMKIRNMGNVTCNEICDKAKEYGIVIRSE